MIEYGSKYMIMHIELNLIGDAMSKTENVIIIGGGVAGFLVAERIKEKCPSMKIIIFTKETYGNYSTCGIPFTLDGKVKIDDIILHKPDYYREEGIDLRAGTTVTKIDLDKRTVYFGNDKMSYDYLVFATGRIPSVPPIPGNNLTGVYTLNNFGDALRVKEAIEKANYGMIIGAGAIGLESAAAIANVGVEVTVVEMLPWVLPRTLDQDMASMIQKKLEDIGIRVLTDCSVSSINGKEKVESVTIKNKKIPTNLVIISAGTRPNVNLARDAGIEIGNLGGIITDYALHVKKGKKYLQNVFALGDCVEVMNGITHHPSISAFTSTAYLQAKAIARNICGEKAVFGPCISPNISVIAGLQVGSVGVTSFIADHYGIKLTIGKAMGLTRAGYHPDKKQIHIKLLAHKERLVGAQIVAEEDVKERINLLSLSIKNRISIRDLLNMERCFMPAVSQLADPLVKALENIVKQS